MLLTRYEPWSAMRQLQNEMSRVFDNAVAGAEDGSNVVTSRWTPAVDIREDTGRFVLSADIPGIEPKDIEITMENGVLTIKGERKLETQDKGDQRLPEGGAGVRQFLSPIHASRHRRRRGHIRQWQAWRAGGGDSEARGVAAQAHRGLSLKAPHGPVGRHEPPHRQMLHDVPRRAPARVLTRRQSQERNRSGTRSIRTLAHASPGEVETRASIAWRPEDTMARWGVYRHAPVTCICGVVSR